MTDPRVQIVADGYDVIGETFAEWRDRIVGDPRAAWRGELVSRLPQGARVLELGCGGGVPDTQLLAERFRVTGVDVSPEQVRRASAAVPSAEFVCADFTELELDRRSRSTRSPASTRSTTSRATCSRRCSGASAAGSSPAACFMTALGTSNTEGWIGEWLGAPMFFSSFPPLTNSRLVRARRASSCCATRSSTFVEPEGEAVFQWILGRA